MNESDVIDPAVIESLRDLNTAEANVLAEVIGYFLEDTPKLVEQVASAAERGDPQALFQAAHALRSVAANLGARRLAAVCDAVQDRGWKGSVEGATDLVIDLRRETEAAARVLETILTSS